MQVYKNLTGDRAIDKNELFYAHGVYQPTLTRQKATSTINGQSSFAVMTNSFLEPNNGNFGSLIIKNGSETSNKIKEYIETTKSWLQIESVTPESNNSEIEAKSTTPEIIEERSDIKPLSEQNGIEAGLTPEPIPF